MRLCQEKLLLNEPIIHQTTGGLTVAVIVIPGMEKKIGLLSCPFGSITQKISMAGKLIEIPGGTAHFLEHKLFESQDGVNVFEYFADIGASCNAYTGFDQTNFLFSTCENHEQALLLLLDFVQNIYLTEESFIKEKKVIEQEILMYEDHPGWRALLNLLTGMYHYHPVREDIAGSLESLAAIDEEMIEFCHEIFYHPQNLLLAIAGDLDSERIIALIDRKQGELRRNDYKEYSVLPTYEPRNVKQSSSVEKCNVAQPIFYLGYKLQGPADNGKTLLREKIIYALLLDILFGPGSAAFYKMYDDGLIDDSFSSSYSGSADFGHIVIGGRTNYPNLLKERLLFYVKSAEDWIKEEDLARTKKKLWGGFVAGLNSLEVLAGQFVNDYRRGTCLIDHFRCLADINLLDLTRLLADELKDENVCFSVIEPLSR